MLKSIWYLFKVLIVIGFAVFLAVQPGTVQLTWRDYTFRDVHLGAVAVMLFMLMATLMILTGFFYQMAALPRELSRRYKEKRRTRGYQALVNSLTAAAAGDHKHAYYLAHRAQTLLPENESGIPLLLKAHAAKSRGHNADTDQAFKELLKNADTALLGAHGLMQKAMIQGDYPQALRLAREAQSKQPRNLALLKPVYDLEIRNRLWDEALVTLEKAVSGKVIPRYEADHDRTAIYCILGDRAKAAGQQEEAFRFYKKACDLSPYFAPAVDRLARSWLDRGQRLRALYLVKKAWIGNPHPDLMPLWDMLTPRNEQEPHKARYRWFEWIQEFHPDKSFAVLALARVAIEEGLWGEARAALVRAEKIEPSAQLYRLWVMLEERTGNKADNIRQWLDRAANAPAPKTWTCQKTGRQFDRWVAIVEPEGFFNTVVFGDRAPAPDTLADPSRWLLDRSAA
jgi:HemY protein